MTQHVSTTNINQIISWSELSLFSLPSWAASEYVCIRAHGWPYLQVQGGLVAAAPCYLARASAVGVHAKDQAPKPKCTVSCKIKVNTQIIGTLLCKQEGEVATK